MLKHWPALTAFALLIIGYTAINVVLPTNAETLTRYDLTVGEARALRLTIALPLIMIWTIAMYGYLRFKNYALYIEHQVDGKALSRIAGGFLALVLWLPLSSLMNNSVAYLYTRYPHLTEELVVARNHITVGLVLFVIYLIWKGSEQLIKAGGLQNAAQLVNKKLNILAVIIGTLFICLVVFNPSQNTPVSPTIPGSYYVPDWILLFTIAIPYALIWFWGIRAVANIHVYSRHTKGIIYRDALGYLAKGLAVSIVSFLTIRFLSSIPAWITSLNLQLLLLLLYVLVFMIGVGAIFLAIGAKRLQKIEEV